MKRKSTPFDRPVNRRQFFGRLAALGGAAAAAASLPARAAELPEPGPDARRTNGYRLTPHIRKYYETAAGGASSSARGRI